MLYGRLWRLRENISVERGHGKGAYGCDLAVFSKDIAVDKRAKKNPIVVNAENVGTGRCRTLNGTDTNKMKLVKLTLRAAGTDLYGYRMPKEMPGIS